MSGEVFRGGADGYSTLENLESDIGPFTDGLEVDATVDKSLCQVTSSCAQGVRSYCYRASNFVSLKEFNGLERKS